MHFHPHKSHAEVENLRVNEEKYFNNGDFQNVVRSEQDPFLKELYQLIRRYQPTFRPLFQHNLLDSPFLAFSLSLTPSCTKDEFKQAITEAVTPVYLSNDCLELHISILKPKYITKERPPIVIVKNKELNLPLRQILEDFMTQMLNKLKDAPST